MFKKLFKNQRGLTLIELLAVVVILGIIAAIAIPAIGGMIVNSKKDAHIANAQQIANAARMYYTNSAADTITTAGKTVTLDSLIKERQIEEIKDPSGTGTSAATKNYSPTATSVLVKKESTTSNKLVYFVTLKSGNGNTTYTNTTTVDAKDLARTNITLP